MATRDGYSNFGFFDGLSPQDTDGSALEGTDFDTQGFDTVTFTVFVGDLTSAGTMSADNRHTIALQHADVSSVASTASTYVAVGSVDMIRTGSGAITSGVWQSIASTTDGSTIYQIGYRGSKRFVRLHFSGNGAPSVMSVCAIAIGGLPANWPVNSSG